MIIPWQACVQQEAVTTKLGILKRFYVKFIVS